MSALAAVSKYTSFLWCAKAGKSFFIVVVFNVFILLDYGRVVEKSKTCAIDIVYGILYIRDGVVCAINECK